MANGVSLEGMQYQDDWQRFLQHLQNRGVAIDPTQSGGYAPRNIAGTNTPSQHAFGRAMDVNFNANPEGASTNAMPAFDVAYGPDAPPRPATMQITPDIAREAAQLFNMKWGGDFRGRSPDPMHFELARSVPQAPQGGPLQASVGGYPPPTTATAPAPALVPARPPVEDRSLAGRMLGAEAAGTLRGIYQGVGPGLSVLLNMPHLASLGTNERAANRADVETGIHLQDAAQRRTTFGQTQAEYLKRQQIFGAV